MCRASDDHRAIDFPEWRGSGLQGRFKDLRWQLLATDGGTTATLLDYQLPRLEQLKLRPSVVTLTDGGNDVLSCYGDTQAALETIATVRQRVGTALDVLRTLTQPLARVVVGTVYDPSDGTGDAATVGLPPWPADRDLWYCNIIEPNAWGANGVRGGLPLVATRSIGADEVVVGGETGVLAPIEDSKTR